MNGKLRSEWYSTLDYAKYFIKRWVFRLYLKASNEELVQREVGREFQTLGFEKQKEIICRGCWKDLSFVVIHLQFVDDIKAFTVCCVVVQICCSLEVRPDIS